MPEGDPTRIVADADVLAADLLVGGAAREALDHVRRHSWLTLVASDALLDDADAVIEALVSDAGGAGARDPGDPALPTDWRDRIDQERERVDHPPGDHPGLASAYRGGAAHLLTFDADLRSAKAGLSIQPHANLSVRTPDAFARLFDATALYEATHEGEYPGPDRDPRG